MNWGRQGTKEKDERDEPQPARETDPLLLPGQQRRSGEIRVRRHSPLVRGMQQEELVEGGGYESLPEEGVPMRPPSPDMHSFDSQPPLLEIPEEVYSVRKAALQVLKPLTKTWVRSIGLPTSRRCHICTTWLCFR